MDLSLITSAIGPIWERVLQRTSIGPEENFFDLGGTSDLADKLFANIAEECGREIPSAAIAYAPTIASLSALLSRPSWPSFSPLIQVKLGTKLPPIFMVHGLSGAVTDFFDIARHVETERPIYGIQARGVDGLTDPLERVEEMSELYLKFLEEIQPMGPYFFIGYSFGGMIALEMAQRLSAAGKQIALLTMLDTYPSEEFLPASQRLRLLLKRVQYHSRMMRGQPFPGSLRYLANKAGMRLGVVPREPTKAERHAIGARRLSFAQTCARVFEKSRIAMVRYRPSFYDGEIRHVSARTESIYLPNDPIAAWRGLAPHIKAETAPGDHEELVERETSVLGAILTRHIRDATQAPDTSPR